MTIRFTLRQLEYFVAVGETGSVAKAAKHVNVTSPSISLAISQLEKTVGLQLFVRKHAHGLSLTNSGRQFFKEARALLASAEQLAATASDISQTVSGPLNVGCFRTFAPVILPELRRQFEIRYPDVSIAQSEGDHAQLLQNIQNGDVDIAITYDLDMPAAINFEALAELPPYVMLPTNHELAGQTRITPEQLAPHPMVLLDMPGSAGYFLSLFEHAGIKPNIAERTRDMALMRSMVANGFGYSLANIKPHKAVSPDGKMLKLIPLVGGLRPLKLGLATSKEQRKLRVVQEFETHCRQMIGGNAIFRPS